MVRFRTEVEIPDIKKRMGYRHKSLMIGSCFTENIGTNLQYLCFPVIVNPFGILYNPVSIANCIEMLVSEKKFSGEDLFYANGLYNSFSHNGRFSSPDQLVTLTQINFRAAEASEVLKEGHHLIITFGTSWVFEHKNNGTVVSNCHKLPAATFDRYRLSVGQIIEIWIPLIEKLQTINPKLHLVFTVSPIRHLSDGAHGNQLSKATLILAIDALISRFGSELISYFPSYELLLDELRDYRFFASDMTHPGDTAVEFFREKFADTLLDNEAVSISTELGKILQSIKHKPLNENHPDYISFIKKQVEKVLQFQNKYPFVDVKRVLTEINKKRTV